MGEEWKLAGKVEGGMMTGVYRITLHAMNRIRERGISPLDVSAAMNGDRIYPAPRGMAMGYDPASRCAVFFNPYTKEIVTAYRLKKKQIKILCSKPKLEKKGGIMRRAISKRGRVIWREGE